MVFVVEVGLIVRCEREGERDMLVNICPTDETVTHIWGQEARNIYYFKPNYTKLGPFTAPLQSYYCKIQQQNTALPLINFGLLISMA